MISLYLVGLTDGVPARFYHVHTLHAATVSTLIASIPSILALNHAQVVLHSVALVARNFHLEQLEELVCRFEHLAH